MKDHGSSQDTAETGSVQPANIGRADADRLRTSLRLYNAPISNPDQRIQRLGALKRAAADCGWSPRTGEPVTYWANDWLYIHGRQPISPTKPQDTEG